MALGEICNEHGDIEFCRLPTMTGKLALPFGQAFRAMSHGWRWVGAIDVSDTENWIVVQRGGERITARR